MRTPCSRQIDKNIKMANDNPLLRDGVSAAIQKRWQKLASYLITKVVEGRQTREEIMASLVDISYTYVPTYTYYEVHECWSHLESEGIFCDIGNGTIKYCPRGAVQ